MPRMKWIEPIVFSKSSGNPIFGQIFGHQRAKNEARDTKMNRGQETHPIRVNARYEMNWVNSFFKKFRKPCLQTDGRTDGRTDRHRGESNIPPFHLRWSGGITIGYLFYATSSFVYHFKTSCEFELELQFENAQFGSKLTIFFSRVTLKFDRWPWKTIGHLF